MSLVKVRDIYKLYWLIYNNSISIIVHNQHPTICYYPSV